jgi:hypothetical protein
MDDGPIQPLDLLARKRIEIVNAMADSWSIPSQDGFTEALDETEALIADLVGQARTGGHGWFEIGVALRMTEDQAQERFA